MADEQEWELDTGTRRHRVVTAEGGTNVAAWYVDGELVARKKVTEDEVVLVPGDRVAAEDGPSDDEPESPETDETEADDEPVGAIRVKRTWTGDARRVSWFAPTKTLGVRISAKTAAHTDVGGLDLDPDPGSPAALREERVRRHPRLYAARHVVGGVAKVVVPIVAVWLLARLAFSVPLPSIPWPDIPWPDIDLPSIPWPSIDLPSISLPRLDWEPPGWLQVVVDNAKYVVPVLIGIGFAYGETRRRRKQDERKAALRAGAGTDRTDRTDPTTGRAPQTEEPGEPDDPPVGRASA